MATYVNENIILAIVNASGSAIVMIDPTNLINVIEISGSSQEENVSNILISNCSNSSYTSGYEIAEVDLISSNIYYSYSTELTLSSDNRVLLAYLPCLNPPSSVSYVSSLIDSINLKY